jgi:preprotein translocase subunit SecA
MQKLARVVLLQATDYYWKEHLSNMDHLKEGIGLRGYGQKNPLHEYQREAYQMFAGMMIAVQTSVLQNIFIPELPSESEIQEIEERERELQRQREAQAQTIHEDVLDSASEERKAALNEGLNRRQRRLQAAQQKAVRSAAEVASVVVSSNQKKRKRKKAR